LGIIQRGIDNEKTDVEIIVNDAQQKVDLIPRVIIGNQM